MKHKLIAVAGASVNHDKWGWKIFNSLIINGFNAVPVNPHHELIDNHECFPNLSSIKVKPDLVIIVTQPRVSLLIVKECVKLGIKEVWLQPRSESAEVINYCKKHGVKVTHNACFLVSNNL